MDIKDEAPSVKAGKKSTLFRAVKGRMGESYSETIGKICTRWQEKDGKETPELLLEIDEFINAHGAKCEEISAPFRGNKHWEEFNPKAVITEEIWRRVVSFFPLDSIAEKYFGTEGEPEPLEEKSEKILFCMHCGKPRNSEHIDSNCPNYIHPADKRRLDWNLGYELNRAGLKNDLRLNDKSRPYIKMGYEARERMNSTRGENAKERV